MKAIVNPDDLRKFSAQVRNYSADMQKNLTDIKGRMNELNNSWQDQENAQFTEKFAQSLAPVLKIMEEMDTYGQFLIKKAEPIEAYLKYKV
jgi:uncharacterized protein YukE